MKRFLIVNKTVQGEVVWLTVYGWVLLGPPRNDGKYKECEGHSVKLSFVQANIECLWQLRVPPREASTSRLPVFPLRHQGGRYEAGLLWKSEKRPDDN